jgi:hypothetical protein
MLPPALTFSITATLDSDIVKQMMQVFIFSVGVRFFVYVCVARVCECEDVCLFVCVCMYVRVFA